MVQVGQQVKPGDGAIFPQRDGETEPGRIGALGGLRQLNELLAVLEAFPQEGKVVLARLNEVGRLVQLRQAAGGLHVSDLEVVAHVTVGVLVIVALRQLAQFPAKALAAGVVLAGRAVAVAAPVAEALSNRLEFVIVGEDGAALAHGNVVGRVEA